MLWLDPPVLAMLTTVGGVVLLSIKVLESLILLSSTLLT